MVGGIAFVDVSVSRREVHLRHLIGQPGEIVLRKIGENGHRAQLFT